MPGGAAPGAGRDDPEPVRPSGDKPAGLTRPTRSSSRRSIRPAQQPGGDHAGAGQRADRRQASSAPVSAGRGNLEQRAVGLVGEDIELALRARLDVAQPLLEVAEEIFGVADRLAALGIVAQQALGEARQQEVALPRRERRAVVERRVARIERVGRRRAPGRSSRGRASRPWPARRCNACPG